MLTNFSRELELSDRLETEYLRILCYDFAGPYSDSYQSYECPRLCIIREGGMSVTTDGQTFPCGPRQFMLMPPASTVHMTISSPARALVFELSDDLIRRVCEKVTAGYRTDYDLPAKDRLLCARLSPDLRGVIGRIRRLLAGKDRENGYVMGLYAQELVYQLLQIRGARRLLSMAPDYPVNRAIRYMKDRYRSPLSIRQISDNLGMSEANFCQYFKKITGVSPKEYLTNLRMEKARDIVIHHTVTDAAFDLGYENISHFITLFKGRYGVTPKQYQKMSLYVAAGGVCGPND